MKSDNFVPTLGMKSPNTHLSWKNMKKERTRRIRLGTFIVNVHVVMYFLQIHQGKGNVLYYHKTSFLGVFIGSLICILGMRKMLTVS